MQRKAIVMDPRDDVATALTPLRQGETVRVTRGSGDLEVELLEEIPFGHKFALREITTGEAILKYGLPIGKALEAIRAGAWVHVHNTRSDRFGHRHEKYGINA